MKAIFDRLGFSSIRHLATGMEGEVFEIGDGLVGKIWASQTVYGLDALREFYQELAGSASGLITPLIHSVHQVDDCVVSIESLIDGIPLKSALRENAIDIASARAKVVDAVVLMNKVSKHESSRLLPLMRRSDAQESRSFNNLLRELIFNRTCEVQFHFEQLVSEFNRKRDAIVERLAAMDLRNDCLVHGDICPENILIDQASGNIGLIDWGFLTCTGDNRFDAATASAFFDMYGSQRLEHSRLLRESFGEVLGYNVSDLFILVGAYACLGANAYSDSLDDGHFQWCIAQLNSPELDGALSLR